MTATTVHIGGRIVQTAACTRESSKLDSNYANEGIDIDISITRSESGTRGRYSASVDGGKDAGQLTYTRVGDDTLIADHTGVPKALRQQGIAAAMVERLVTDARAEGQRIVPSCPYVKAWFDRHPEWSEYLTDVVPDT